MQDIVFVGILQSSGDFHADFRDMPIIIGGECKVITLRVMRYRARRFIWLASEPALPYIFLNTKSHFRLPSNKRELHW